MPISQTSIIVPCLAMVAITAVVWLRLYFERVGEMRSRGIAAQAIATSREAGKRLHNTNAADNFSNLFEIPVLFYVLCVLAFAANAVTPLLVAARGLLWRCAQSIASFTVLTIGSCIAFRCIYLAR